LKKAQSKRLRGLDSLLNEIKWVVEILSEGLGSGEMVRGSYVGIDGVQQNL
jgi:hypothetical protein